MKLSYIFIVTVGVIAVLSGLSFWQIMVIVLFTAGAVLFYQDAQG